VNGLAAGRLLGAGTEFAILDTPDLVYYHPLTVGFQVLLVMLLLANLGVFVYMRSTHKTQAARWFGVGTLVSLLVVSLLVVSLCLWSA
jgi:hypothetical protein